MAATGWSITHKEPSTAPDASINSSTGVANFPANQSTTTDNVYTIQYDNGNGCTETTTYTVKKCVPSCTCTASAGGNVQCEASTSLVSVGSYTSNNCSGSWSATHKSGANFLYDFSFSNGTISAKVQQGSTTSTQSGTYTIGIDNCTHDVTFTQEKCSSEIILEGCSDISYDLFNVIISEDYYTYDATEGNTTFNIRPIYYVNGRSFTCYCKETKVYPYTYELTPEKGNNPTGSVWSDFWYVMCDDSPDEQWGTTGGTSGGATSTVAEVRNAFVDKGGTPLEGLVTGSHYCKLEATSVGTDSAALSYTSDWSGNNPFHADPCSWTSKVDIGVGMRVEFEIYKNQTTMTGETFKCTLDLYVDAGVG